MMVKLNMSIVGQPGLSSTDIAPGLLCCASSIIDKRWYRAVVISAHDGSGGVSLCEGRGGECVCVGKRRVGNEYCVYHIVLDKLPWALIARQQKLSVDGCAEDL